MDILFTFGAIASSIAVIFSSNPIYSVFFLILVFCNSAGLLILMDVDFLAMILVVVYVGAIAVLFLFVVMMFQLSQHVSSFSVTNIPLGFIVGVTFLTTTLTFYDEHWVGSSLRNSQPVAALFDSITTIQVLGLPLYTEFFIYFLSCGLILFVAMLGAIALTSHSVKGVKRQDIHQQIEHTASTH